MRKAYGRTAGPAALVVGSALIAMVFAVSTIDQGRMFAVMAVLGPAMVLQYVYWARRSGQERTTRQYLETEPRHDG